jgi:hypothetical protein
MWAALYKLLSTLLIGAAALVAAALFFQPWALIDPIDRFIHMDGTSRSMIPEVFSPDEPAAIAMDRLARAGYSHSTIEPATSEPAHCGDVACRRRKAGFTDFFRKSGVAFNIACSLDHVVWLKRDGDRVVVAQNDVYDACL